MVLDDAGEGKNIVSRVTDKRKFCPLPLSPSPSPHFHLCERLNSFRFNKTAANFNTGTGGVAMESRQSSNLLLFWHRVTRQLSLPQHRTFPFFEPPPKEKPSDGSMAFVCVSHFNYFALSLVAVVLLVPFKEEGRRRKKKEEGRRGGN